MVLKSSNRAITTISNPSHLVAFTKDSGHGLHLLSNISLLTDSIRSIIAQNYSANVSVNPYRYLGQQKFDFDFFHGSVISYSLLAFHTMVVVATSQYLRFAAQFRILLQGPQKDMPKARRVRGWKCLFTEWILGSLADFQDTVLWRLSVVVIKQLYKYVLRFSTSIFELDEIFSARFFIVLFQLYWVSWNHFLACVTAMHHGIFILHTTGSRNGPGSMGSNI